jgi:hypothetical protein
MARISAWSAGTSFSAKSSATADLTWRWALRAMSAMIRVWSSTSAMGFCSTTFKIDAAGYCPSCGSTGPSTALSSMTISSAARAIRVPPDMA